MQMTVTNTEKAAIISAAGRMDAVTAPQFDKRLETLIAEGATRIIIDFRDLEYISSAGLQSILALAKRLEPVDGDVILCNLGGPVKEVFDISGFSIIFPIFDSLADARASG